MSLATTIDAMVAAGCTPEQLAAVVRAHEAKAEARQAEKRALAAKRQATYRERHPKSNASNASNALPASPDVTERHTASNASGRARGEVLPNSLDSNLSPTKEPPKGGSKGKVLSPDWQPSIADLDYARSQGLAAPQLEIEIEKFRNHFLGKGGRDAARRDWSATWRNWVLRWREMAPRPRQQARGSPGGFAAVLDALEGRTDEPAYHEKPMRDVTPRGRDEPRDRADLHEPTGRVSGRGEVLDFHQARADLGGSEPAFWPTLGLAR